MTLEEIAKQIRWGRLSLTIEIADGKVVRKVVYPQVVNHPLKIEGIKGEVEIYKEIDITD